MESIAKSIELQIMMKLKNADGISHLIAHGIFPQTGYMWLALEKLGPNLKHLLKRNHKNRFSTKTTIQIGIQLIDRLKLIHKKGILHLDLKPQNILIGSDDLKSEESSKVYLIDFGVSVRYLGDDGEHLRPRKNVPFGGNMLFASPNAFRRLCKLAPLLILIIYCRVKPT